MVCLYTALSSTNHKHFAESLRSLFLGMTSYRFGGVGPLESTEACHGKSEVSWRHCRMSGAVVIKEGLKAEAVASSL